jgi:hypothetical protein
LNSVSRLIGIREGRISSTHRSLLVNFTALYPVTTLKHFSSIHSNLLTYYVSTLNYIESKHYKLWNLVKLFVELAPGMSKAGPK